METLTSLAPTEGQRSTALEKVRPDLNLEKWSIWQPASSHNKKTRTLKRDITLDNGDKVTSEVTIGYIDRYGIITTEDQKTCYALFKLWEDKGRPTEQTHLAAPEKFESKRFCSDERTWAMYQ